MWRERQRDVNGARKREGCEWAREGSVSGAREGCEWGKRVGCKWGEREEWDEREV